MLMKRYMVLSYQMNSGLRRCLLSSKSGRKYFSLSSRASKFKGKTFGTFDKRFGRNMEEELLVDRGYTRIGSFDVYPWAISGLESSIVVKGPQKDACVCFDMGYAHREAVKCINVFISHGHMDHVAGIPNHVAKRGLYNWKPYPTYYVPVHLEKPLIEVLKNFSIMTESDLLKLCHIKTIAPGQEIKLGNRFIKAFKTIHRVESQGYIISREAMVMKPEYEDLPGPEKGRLAKDGVQLREKKTFLDLAYTGDTTFDVFLNPPDPDLLKVKLLITESTYIDHEEREGRSGIERAVQRGHSHLQQFVDNAHLFENVDKIMLLHFSDKYSLGYLKKQCDEILQGSSLQDKVVIGNLLKEKFPK